MKNICLGFLYLWSMYLSSRSALIHMSSYCIRITSVAYCVPFDVAYTAQSRLIFKQFVLLPLTMYVRIVFMLYWCLSGGHSASRAFLLAARQGQLWTCCCFCTIFPCSLPSSFPLPSLFTPVHKRPCFPFSLHLNWQTLGVCSVFVSPSSDPFFPLLFFSLLGILGSTVLFFSLHCG